uniref:Uncharacterized protein n=1 Tax=Lactuca sativa TaxID=4236 RepID=A0A9R1XAU2_LACSA|nr:hypothetical protein LSAT_V11C500245740 [Lactuca sativa]
MGQTLLKNENLKPEILELLQLKTRLVKGSVSLERMKRSEGEEEDEVEEEGDPILSVECSPIWSTDCCERSFTVDGCDPLQLVAIDRTQLYSLNDRCKYDVVRIHLWVVVKKSPNVKKKLDAKATSILGELGCECESSFVNNSSKINWDDPKVLRVLREAMKSIAEESSRKKTSH